MQRSALPRFGLHTQCPTRQRHAQRSSLFPALHSNGLSSQAVMTKHLRTPLAVVVWVSSWEAVSSGRRTATVACITSAGGAVKRQAVGTTSNEEDNRRLLRSIIMVARGVARTTALEKAAARARLFRFLRSQQMETTVSRAASRATPTGLAEARAAAMLARALGCRGTGEAAVVMAVMIASTQHSRNQEVLPPLAGGATLYMPMAMALTLTADSEVGKVAMVVMHRGTTCTAVENHRLKTHVEPRHNRVHSSPSYNSGKF